MVEKKLIQKVHYKQMTWKNGLGVTAEIDRYPLVSDPYLWRLSQATIAQDAPFSSYPGYDRLLAIAEGNGIYLNNEMFWQGSVIRFSGDIESSCQLIGDPVKDLGLIFDRERIEAEMLFVSGKIELKREATHFFYNMKSGDTLKVEQPGSIEIEPSIQVSIWSKRQG